MRRMVAILVAVSVGCFLLLFGLMEATDPKQASSQPAANGTLDLTALDLAENQVIPLDGGWAFYWNELLAPGATPTAAPAFIQVPGFWRHVPVEAGSGPGPGKSIASNHSNPDAPISNPDAPGSPNDPSNSGVHSNPNDPNNSSVSSNPSPSKHIHSAGAGTFRLKLKLTPSRMVYGLRVSNIRMASEIYVNGHKVGGSGQPALTRADYSYINKPYNAFFAVEGDTADIVIHVANFENDQGGIPYSLFFGSADAIHSANTHSLILNLSLIVSLLMLGSYQLSIFIIRREERGLLYFGLSCVVIGWSFATNGDRLLLEFLPMPPELYYKLQAVSLYASLITMTLFINSMGKGLIPRWFVRVTGYGTAGYIAFVLVAPFAWYSPFNSAMGLLQLVAYLIVIGMLVYAYLVKNHGGFNRKSLGLFIVALSSYFLGLIDFALYLNSLARDYKPGYYAILVFCFLGSFLMSYRFSEAYKTIERMAGKLTQADKQKDAFLLQTSHEFQTPLHGMINLSQNMLETGAGQLNASQMQNLSVIRDTSRRLSALVNDILDMEKIKRDELSVQLSEVDVRVTVSLVFELLRHMIAGKKIRLINAVAEELPPVYADENRLKQIIHNLLGNAIKFTQEGTITVSAQVMGNQVKVLVEDTGAGIEPSQWNSVFQAFEQAHSPREYGGTGLGLYICRKLLHLMDGDIYIDWSEPDRGTGIAFTLPLAARSTLVTAQATARMELASSKEEQPREIEQAERMAEPMDQVEHPAGYYTLLAVDDEPANLQVLSRLFADQPCQVLLAANGREALELLSRHSDISLVLLDVMMPKMSGYEVCQEIRKRYSLFELPVILLTALHASEDIAAGFKAGANDFITKPFDASEVRVRTETLLQLKRSVEASFRAELDFLQSQIKPHFLYNALNSIISMCQTDAPRAEKLITHLSNYLRKSFDPRPDSFIRVQEELQLVEAYVEIEKARFEERLTVLYEVEEAALGKRILPLTIQPLVENAIRHGVMKQEDGGTVRVTVKLLQGALCVEVWDNGVGMSREKLAQLGKPDPTAKRQGVGYANIKRRLRHFCGVELEVESKEGEWTRFQFRLEA